MFDSGLPITMVPLDVTHQVRSTPERIARIRALGSPTATIVADLLEPAPGREPSALLRGPRPDACWSFCVS